MGGKILYIITNSLNDRKSIYQTEVTVGLLENLSINLIWEKCLLYTTYSKLFLKY